ncbi:MULTISPECIES: hypothetical protein [unclassified Moraxella]|uniref:hypothetical protein n=1 Tax=unclassified Moraxella TaxID=2685852 RepID=UPI003AF866CB
MLNPIHAIKQLYTLDIANASTTLGISREVIEQHESELGIQLPPMLYHYLHELGNGDFNTHYHHFVELPFEKLDDYVVIGKTCDDDGVWGIALKDLSQHDPMVMMSRNFDAIEPSEVHWFKELPLSAFLLAQAIINGVNGGLAHHAQVYDFAGDTIPHDLADKLVNLTTEIDELHRPHERYFHAPTLDGEDFGVAMVVSVDEDRPTAFLMGSQHQGLFEQWIQQLLD